ncbi:MAG TPA: DUF3999 family protein [Pyrinomonadaceae bacterium]|jgi:hypothetical protein|nr:DUF3999 family protein [Pyrinomonadaceae bacterium]
MKKLSLVLLLLLSVTLSTSIVAVFAQSSMTPWPYFVNVTPHQGPTGTYDVWLPLEVMDKSREDLADLRLYDAGGHEIPYALRIRRGVEDNREVAVSGFNEATTGLTSELSLDQGENAGEHNEVEVETGGTNFRRRVDLEGSDSGKEWRTLRAGGMILNFESEGRSVVMNRVSYPTSRYRYLRVRVFADEVAEKKAPEITNVKVVMGIHQPGELATWEVTAPSHELLRNHGAPASSWTIDLGGRVPVDRLALEIGEESFSRPFQLEEISDPQNIRLLASGELTRRIGDGRRPVTIAFDNEEYARRLRLLITDYSNQTLSITAIKASAPARQLVFELKQADAKPLRLFFGNPNAIAPHYDFEKDLPAKLVAPPTHSDVGSVVRNPDYVPEPLPLTERIPWLIYLVLAASSIALALILLSLARTTLNTAPAPGEGSGLREGS